MIMSSFIFFAIVRHIELFGAPIESYFETKVNLEQEFQHSFCRSLSYFTIYPGFGYSNSHSCYFTMLIYLLRVISIKYDMNEVRTWYECVTFFEKTYLT